LLLQSFWANGSIFQLKRLAYNLFLLFKMDFAKETEYRQQIKTFRLKYIFLAGKIIRTTMGKPFPMSEFVKRITKRGTKCGNYAKVK
jgi:hypothetical protein